MRVGGRGYQWSIAAHLVSEPLVQPCLVPICGATYNMPSDMASADCRRMRAGLQLGLYTLGRGVDLIWLTLHLIYTSGRSTGQLASNEVAKHTC